jgi:hypothetical protein
MFPRFFLHTAFALILVLSLSACGLRNYQEDADKNYVFLSAEKPPAPEAETAPLLTDMRTQIWRPGYWMNDGYGFYWIQGEIIDRPSPTAVWAPDHWVQHNFGWALVAGHWQ